MEADLPELTQEETAEMHRMVSEMEECGCAADVYTLSLLATETGNAWLRRVREMLPQWRGVPSANLKETT